MSETRFALYFAPDPASALARFGQSWLGRSPERADSLPLPQLGLDPHEQAAAIAQARFYGFHATLKAPFRLALGQDRDRLIAALRHFTAAQPGFTEPPLRLATLQGFLALRLSRPSTRVTALATDCVREFDLFRAPPTDAERRKRLAAPLSQRQRALLERWGYPYVLSQFRFHMTLTGALGTAQRRQFRQALLRLAAPALAEPVAFESLCLFEQPQAEAPFRLTQRFPFAAGAAMTAHCGDAISGLSTP